MPIRGKTNKQTKHLSTNRAIYKVTQTTGPTLGGHEPKGRKNSTVKPGKRRPQTNKQKRKERQKNTTQVKEQSINTEVQINEEEIVKLPEKEFRIMRVKMIKNLENKMEKIQISTNKAL